MQKISEVIKKARTDKNISIERLAASVGVSRNYIPRIESGEKEPSIKLAHAILKYLDTTYTIGAIKNNTSA